MKTFLLVAMLTFGASPPADTLPTAHIDLIELNHKYDKNGKHNIDQLIFYDWDQKEVRYQVRGWAVVDQPTAYPRPCDEGFESIFRVRLTVVTVRVVASKYRETWTQHDPEIIERRYLPREERKPLFPWMNDGLPPNPQAGIPAAQETPLGVWLRQLLHRLVE